MSVVENFSGHRLGRDGPLIGPVAWGMWRLSGSTRETGDLVRAALDHGLNLLDTADIYGFDGVNGFGAAESLLGAVLAEDPHLRSRMVLATKGGISPGVPYDQSNVYLSNAIDQSLRRLQTDRIDLYQIHRPDLLTHPEDLAKTLLQAVQAGKILQIGVSNFTPAQIETLVHFLDLPLASTQPEVSALRIDCFENGELDQAMRLGLTSLAWSPLGGGRLIDPRTKQERAVAAALDRVGADAGVSRSVAALSWLMAHPAAIVPIVGTQNSERIVEAASAARVRWTRAQWYCVFEAARGEKLP